ncbi:MAG: SUMF1/EgtB/PvdO family nonheme iron enzyme, partial [Nitrospira sp.]|nr:SUMF1/EgtB/PvdO family nonheme iron enzyme [Nitrospira sp.]
ESLASGLKQAFQKITIPANELATNLAKNTTTIGALLANHLSADQEVLLFVDQLEELFTLGFKDEDIQHFLEQLVATTRDSQNRVRVVTTVRSEFIGKLEESGPVLQMLNAGYNYHLGPVLPRMLQEMMEKPAQATGYEFEPHLVGKILDEAGREPGNLPLVAYTLKQLFERLEEEGQTFTHAAYEAIGGVAGAIGTIAEQVLQTLGAEASAAFDRVFGELVHLERDRPPTRKRVPLVDFRNDPGATTLIQALAGPVCRILVTGEKDKTPTVEVAHEQLFTAWPRLKTWLDQGGDALRLIEHATEEARRWRERGEMAEELWLATRAIEVQEGLKRFGKTPSQELECFLRPQQVLLAQLNQDDLSHKQRTIIGWKMAQFGDTRPGVGLRPDGLPDIVWIEIPPGQIKQKNYPYEFDVHPFRLAKYPVTNRQFKAFIDEGGYKSGKWWKGFHRPEAPEPPKWSEANCPRETVSWYEAVAFCRWLSQRTDSRIRLPTEWEWQQAATSGDPTYEYPWAGGWDAARCNSEKSRLDRTTPVGIYPRGATKQGALDMVGNVWEWCLNTTLPPNLEMLQEDQGPVEGGQVLKGGSWNNTPDHLKASYLLVNTPDWRSVRIGFRLAQDIP